MFKKIKENVSGAFGSVAVFFFLCVFPMAIMNGYHDITAMKQITFCLITVVFTFLCLFTYFLTCSSERLTTLPKLSATDIAMLLFLFVAVFSCISSPWVLTALSGRAARRMGFVTVLATVMAYFLVSRFYKLRRREFIFLGLITIFMCVFSIIQFSGFDPLGFLSTVAVKKRPNFIGFSGNVNMFAALLTLFVPLFFTLFCFEKKVLPSIAWFLFALVGMCGMFATNSDGGILGLVVAFAVLLLVCFKSRILLAKCMFVFSTFFLSMFIFYMIRRIFEEKARISAPLYKIMLDPKVFVPGFVFFTALAVMILAFKPGEAFLLKLRKIYIIAVIAVIALTALLFIYFTLIDKESEIGEASRYFRFNDKWGSKRGYAWKKAMRLYAQAPLARKLIGYGEDNVAMAFFGTYGRRTFSDIGLIFDNVHNYFLQYLITLGAWGMITYTLTLIFALRTAFKDSSYIKTAIAVAICAYIAQSTVNITQPISTPMLYVFLGLAQSRSQVN